MMKKRWISACLLMVILLRVLPAHQAAAQGTTPDQDYDEAALLMISARNRMLGAEDANELRQLRDLRQAHFDRIQQRVQASDLDPDSTAWQLAVQDHNTIQTKLDTRASQLDAARSRARNSNPLRRFTHWVGKGLKKGGRALGAVANAAMTGVGKGAQYAIEEAPRQVLNDVLETGGATLLSGGTVNLAMLKKLALTNWKNRAVKAIKNNVIDQVAGTLTRNGGGDDLDQALRALADQEYDPGAGIPSTLDPDIAGNMDDEPDTSGIPVGPEGDMDYDDGDSGTIPAPMGSVGDSGAVVIGGISSDPNAAGGSNITKMRPVAFKNTGTIPATVKVQSYQPPDGFTGSFPGGSTVVSPDGNSSAYLELPLGRYVFCYDWDLGKDSDGDGYTDYQHASSAQFTVVQNHSTDVNNAVVVTIAAPSSSPSKGRCGQNQPAPAGGEASLTPEELANQGKHTYTESCSYSNGESHTNTGEYDFNFTANGLTESSEAMTKLGPNEYLSAAPNTTFSGTHLTFTATGFMMTGSYADADGSTVTWSCTSTRQ